MALNPDALEEARRLIGVRLRRERHNTEAARSSIFRWAKSIGERNPLFLDEGYARRSSLGSLVAPPCWLYSVDHTMVAVKLPDLHAIYAGTDWEFYRWVRPGDRISVTARLLDVREKEGRFCGPMVLQVGEVVYLDGNGQKLARAVSYTMRTSREEAVRRGKYLGWTKYKYSLEELQAVEDAYDNEQIRGGTPRYWEEVKEGEELPPIVRGPLTSEEIVQFVGATSPIMGFKRFLDHRRRHPGAAFKDPESGMWDSWEASLIDDRVARRFGFPFAHDCGIDRISWIGTLLTNWMGDDGFLKRLEVRLLLPNIYGDVTWCRGRVARRFRRDEEALVECEVWCENQRRQVTARGRALISLPSLGMI